MAVDLDEATQLAIDHVVDEYRQSVVVRACQSPQEAPYGFDPEGWALFVVTDGNYRVGGDKYIGINMETGETKSFGTMGE